LRSTLQGGGQVAYTISPMIISTPAKTDESECVTFHSGQIIPNEPLGTEYFRPKT